MNTVSIRRPTLAPNEKYRKLLVSFGINPEDVCSVELLSYLSGFSELSVTSAIELENIFNNISTQVDFCAENILLEEVEYSKMLIAERVCYEVSLKINGDTSVMYYGSGIINTNEDESNTAIIISMISDKMGIKVKTWKIIRVDLLKIYPYQRYNSFNYFNKTKNELVYEKL